MSLLEIKNLHAEVEGKKILNGLTSRSRRARSPPSWGRTARASRRSPMCSPASPLRLHRGRSAARRREHPRHGAGRARGKGIFLAFQYPEEVPGVATSFLRTALTAAQARSELSLSTPEFIMVRELGRLGIGRTCCAAPSMSASRAARRSATRSCRWRSCSRALRARRDRFRPRHRRAQDRGRRRQPPTLAGSVDGRDHALSALVGITSCPTWCTCWPRAAW